MLELRRTPGAYEFWLLSCGGYLCLREGRPVIIDVADWVGPALVLRLAKEEYGWYLSIGEARPGGRGRLYEVRHAHRLRAPRSARR